MMIEDLSRYHRPVTDLFPALEDWERYRLSDEQVRFYYEHGYLVGIKMLNEEQLDVLRRELAELVDPSHPGHNLFYEFNANESADPEQILFHALGAWRITPGLHDLLWNPAFVVAAAQLLDGPVRFWHDQIFYKPAHHGGVVIWHQDYSYWTRTTPVAHVSCWIGLDDSTLENGCVHYVPGSHRWPLLPRTSFANHMNAILDSLTPAQRDEFKPVAIELKAGECSFHHPFMVHGSYANETPRPRRAVVINAFRDGVLSASNAPLLEGVPPIAAGQKMGGQFFPLLFDPLSLHNKQDRRTGLALRGSGLIKEQPMPVQQEPELNATATAELVVGPEDLASSLPIEMGDAFPAVFATARLVALMEIAAARVLQPLLVPGELSVGVTVDITHTAPTPPGAKVTATARYVEREGKLFVFEVSAADLGGEVGRGRHKRAIVTSERLLSGAAKRVS